MLKHAPLPYYVLEHCQPICVGSTLLGRQIWGPEGRVAFIDQTVMGVFEQGTAAFIANACNAHHAAMDVCVGLTVAARSMQLDEDDLTDPMAQLVRAAREALRKGGVEGVTREEQCDDADEG